jgi:hypothetical protein
MIKIKTIIPIFFIFSSIFGKDEIGSVFIGLDYLPNNEYNETRSGVYKLSKNGISFGVTIPINVPVLDYRYKIKLSKHAVADRAWAWEGTYSGLMKDLYDKHISVLNEFLIGKEFRLNTFHKLGLLPEIGLGVLFDGLYQDGDSPVGGIVYHCLFIDGSFSIRYHLNNIGIGILLNYQKSIRPSWDGYEATDRFCISYSIFR